MLFSFLRSLLRKNGSSRRFPEMFKLSDHMIKQLLNSVIAKCHDLSVYRSLSLALAKNSSARHRQITIFSSALSNNIKLLINIMLKNDTTLKK